MGLSQTFLWKIIRSGWVRLCLGLRIFLGMVSLKVSDFFEGNSKTLALLGKPVVLQTILPCSVMLYKGMSKRAST